jgi:hypothetical protein
MHLPKYKYTEYDDEELDGEESVSAIETRPTAGRGSTAFFIPLSDANSPQL